MTAPSRLSKKDIVDKLVEQGFDIECLKVLKRPQLLALLKEDVVDSEDDDNIDAVAEKILENVEPETEELCETIVVCDNEEQETTPKESPPSMNDPEWTQYVLGKFTDDEIDGKNPRVEGLRRVAQELLGHISEEGCNLVAAPTIDNDMRACVKAWIVIDDGVRQCRFEALADANAANCQAEFGYYPTAMADTRAKGRCFRNALNLKRVLAAEEINPALSMQKDDNDNDAIDPSQSTAIRIMCNRLSISIPKIIEFMKIDGAKDDDNNVDISKLTRGQAKTVLHKLNVYSNTSQKDGLEIPQEIKETDSE